MDGKVEIKVTIYKHINENLFYHIILCFKGLYPILVVTLGTQSKP